MVYVFLKIGLGGYGIKYYCWIKGFKVCFGIVKIWNILIWGIVCIVYDIFFYIDVVRFKRLIVYLIMYLFINC